MARFVIEVRSADQNGYMNRIFETEAEASTYYDTVLHEIKVYRSAYLNEDSRTRYFLREYTGQDLTIPEFTTEGLIYPPPLPSK